MIKRHSPSHDETSSHNIHELDGKQDIVVTEVVGLLLDRAVDPQASMDKAPVSTPCSSGYQCYVCYATINSSTLV